MAKCGALVTLAVFQGVEKCVDLGLIKAIGLSNFSSKQIQQILDNCRFRAVNLQVRNGFHQSMDYGHSKSLHVQNVFPDFIYCIVPNFGIQSMLETNVYYKYIRMNDLVQFFFVVVRKVFTLFGG